MSDLRSKLIRLAHTKPELRKHLLPLIKESSLSKKAVEITELVGPNWTHINTEDLRNLTWNGKNLDRLKDSIDEWVGFAYDPSSQRLFAYMVDVDPGDDGRGRAKEYTAEVLSNGRTKSVSNVPNVLMDLG